MLLLKLNFLQDFSKKNCLGKLINCLYLNLVGNVGDMSACVTTMLTLSDKNGLTPNVAEAMTGFMAGPCVC